MKFTPTRLFLALLPFLAPLGAFGAQDYVSRYDVYAGYVYFESPAINLAERGYHIQLGYNVKPWYAIGFDYSNAEGTLALLPKYLPSNLEDQVNSALNLLINAGILPKTYQPSVTTNVSTQTFALGPTLIIRHFRHFAILLHPSLGAVRELAKPYPADALTQTLVAELIPTPTKLDWQGFYGIGGGVDVGVTKHFGLRMHVDVVYDHLFNDILRDGRWTVRASLGPSLHFGRNIAQ